MTTLVPRPPYSEDELQKLYPKSLELYQVQVILRHGERTPVTARFQNAGLYPHWPYCNAAERFRATIVSSESNSGWGEIQWKRRLEEFGQDDHPVAVRGPSSQSEGICLPGELTDKGRQTTFDLGARLRHLYVDQLRFMPQTLESADSIYLRATPITRALESLQQAFRGMYPPSALSPGFSPPPIVTRSTTTETLFPNEWGCKRFKQLARAFGQRAADRWNNSPEMDQINKRIGKWMPQPSPKVAVDSHPRLSGVLDTTYSTLAHGPETRLPKEFYEAKELVDKIVVEEWFAGYMENLEYRTLGIGALAGDIVERMAAAAESSKASSVAAQDEKRLKLSLSGCHDTTLAALLASLGIFDSEPWPRYTSSIALELFREKELPFVSSVEKTKASVTGSPSVSSEIGKLQASNKPGWLASMLGIFGTISKPQPIGRKKYASLTELEKSKLEGFYVRVRYNDRPMTLPTCRQRGNHLEGDESFCTLEAFKRIVDGFTPKSWVNECGTNLDKGIIGVSLEGSQPAGLIEAGM